MKYSIIFPYRNRLEHLRKTVPYVKIHLENQNIENEIIIIEQDNNESFRRAGTLNAGAKLATGDLLIFHDIDYIPSGTVSYYDGISDVYLPIKRVEFLNNDMTRRPIEDVPSGYAHFNISVDDTFFGAVLSMKKEAFFRIDGYSPLFKNWGFEDEFLRKKIYHYGLTVNRTGLSGLFYALEHKNSEPPMNDPDYLNNQQINLKWMDYLRYGISCQLNKNDIIKPPVLSDIIDVWCKTDCFDIVPDLKEKKR